jgi:hypothetical protein
LGEAQVQGKIGDSTPVIGFDQFLAVRRTAFALRELDAQAGNGRIWRIGEETYQQ